MDNITIHESAQLRDGQTLLLALGFFFFVNIDVLQRGWMGYLFLAVDVTLIAFWGIRYINQIVDNLRRPFFAIALLYTVWTMLIALFKHGLSFGILYSATACFVLVNVIFIERRRAFEALWILYTAIVVLEFISMPVFRWLLKDYANGIYAGILGGKNALPRQLIIAYLIAGLQAKDFKKRKTAGVVCGLILAEFFFSLSATAIVVALTAILFHALLKYKRPRYGTVLMFCGASELILTFGMTSDYVKKLSRVFRKGVDFNGRVEIWQAAADTLKKNLLLGIGRGNTSIVVQFSNGTKGTYQEAHNTTIQILLNGGTIGLLLYFALFYVVLKKCAQVKHLGGRLAVISLVMVFVAGLMESIPDWYGIWMVYGAAYAYAVMKEEEKSVCNGEKAHHRAYAGLQSRGSFGQPVSVVAAANRGQF